MEIKIADVVAVLITLILTVLFFYEKITQDIFIILIVGILAYFGIKVVYQRTKNS